MSEDQGPHNELAILENNNIKLFNKLLIKAAYVADKGATALLLSKGAEINTSTKELKWTPLHITAYEGDLSMAKLLLSKKAKLHIRDKDGRTPLYCATSCNNLEMVSLLLNHGADVQTIDSSGNTLVHLAVDHGNLRLLELLTNRGVQVNVRNNKGRSPLDLATTYGRADIRYFLKKNRLADIIRKLTLKTNTEDHSTDNPKQSNQPGTHTPIFTMKRLPETDNTYRTSFQCQFCDKSFRLKYNKNRHEKIHIRLQILDVNICSQCGKNLRDSMALKNHEERMHGNLQCPKNDCNHTAPDQRRLGLHMQKCMKYVKCDICSIQCSTYSNFRRHLASSKHLSLSRQIPK